MSTDSHHVSALNAPLLSSLWQPPRFFVGNGLRCAFQFEAEQTLPWELFRGQLLDDRQTRTRKTFLTWNLYPVANGEIAGEPLVSLLLDEQENAVSVTRSILSRKWVPVDVDGGISGQQVEGWVRELVGTVYEIDAHETSIGEEVANLISRAIIGTSRLPLTSLEAPLPQFTLGQLAYVSCPVVDGIDAHLPRRHWRELIDATNLKSCPESVRARTLETALRVSPEDEVALVALAIGEQLGRDRFLSAFRTMYNDISLSPYTDFVDRSLTALKALAHDAEGALRSADVVDAIGGLLRKLARHLTGYDLTLFHHRGANYPDAILLDALLRQLVAFIAQSPELFHGDSPSARLRRRALRAGFVLRARYEGHAVPDAPTSPGENARVLPTQFAPVPEEQIHEPHRRQRRLFAESPLDELLTPAVLEVFTLSCRDLREIVEACEGGIALFIDRPLGFFKAAAEVDQTPLLSYVASSRQLATRSLIECRAIAERFGVPVSDEHWTSARRQLDEASDTGVSLALIPEPRRPAASLADARKAASDFVISHTTKVSREAFWKAFRETPKSWPLIARIAGTSGQPIIAAFDESGQVCAEFEGDWSRGSMLRGGVEVPRAGLRGLSNTDAARVRHV